MWFFLVVLVSAVNALINHIDKLLIERYVKGRSIGTLVIFSSLIGVPIAFIVALFSKNVFDISFFNALVLILSGAMYVGWIIPYLHALERDEASRVAPLFQMSSVFSYFLGFVFLGEAPTGVQVFAGILVLSGSLILTLDISGGDVYKMRKDVFYLMGLASFLYALNSFLFKLFNIDNSFWTVAFWEYVGFIVFAICLLFFVSNYRKEFFRLLNQNRKGVFAINITNEMLAIFAKTSFNYALLLAPIALTVLVTEAIQPFFVFFYGIVLTIYFPKLSNEDVDRRNLLHKFLAVLVMSVGLYLLSKV